MVLNAQPRVPGRLPVAARGHADGVAVALTVLGSVVDVPLAVAILIALVYPLALLPLGFYLPAERSRLRRLLGASA